MLSGGLRVVFVLCLISSVGLAKNWDYSLGFWSNKPELTECSDLLVHRTRFVRPPIQQFVMGPLERVTDWDLFSKKLNVLKSLGVHAITTDILWAWVEPEEGHFDWSYYQEYFSRVRAAGLRWVPIFSFHKIGGNVGDNVDVGLPDWAWNKARDMRFVSRTGFVSDEYINFLVPEAYDLYERVMESFRQEFWAHRKSILKIYAGMGPAGELRNPSYSFAAGWDYPQVGEIQAFDPRARQSFVAFLKARYQAIEKLHLEWGLQFSSWEDPAIGPPTDGEQFFKTGRNTPYGRDFLDWYQFTLENHLFEMMHRARRVFLPFGEFTPRETELLQALNHNALTVFYGPSALAKDQRPHFRPGREWEDAKLYWKFRSLEWRVRNPPMPREDFLSAEGSIGVKLAGIHWQHTHPEMPKAAAQAAGYTSYESLLALIRILGGTLTFTCMEMDDSNPMPGSFSAPRQLVEEVAELAQFMDLPHFGENALAMRKNPQGFENLLHVFGSLEIHGFTFLRMGDLVDDLGIPTEIATLYKECITNRNLTRFFYPSQFFPGAVEARGLELRLVADDPDMRTDPLANSVRMTHAGLGEWFADVEMNNPGRLSWQIWLVDPSTSKILARTPWVRPEHLSVYGWKSSDFEGIVVRLPYATNLYAEPELEAAIDPNGRN